MAQEWISVKDRLPEPQQEVLVSVLNDVLFRDIARVGSLDSRGIWRVDTPHEYFHRNITHWMPLPEPPKE